MKYCGVLNIDKPIGLTSREVVNRVVQLVRPAKVGNAGTLDPLATGVLVVCVGYATRLINLIQEGRKRYLAQFVLGQRSDTDDTTGNVTESGDWSQVSKDDLQAVLPEFIGRIHQVPPQFSAVHVAGRRAYDLARAGQAVDLDARPVDVFSLTLTNFQPPEFELDIECGSGTYVRSIGRDLGLKVGCGAVMKALLRLTVGSFDIADAVSLTDLTADRLQDCLQPALNVASHFRTRQLTASEAVAIRCGQSIQSVADPLDERQSPEVHAALQSADPRFALVDTRGELMGIAEFDGERIHPRIVFPADPIN